MCESIICMYILLRKFYDQYYIALYLLWTWINCDSSFIAHNNHVTYICTIISVLKIVFLFLPPTFPGGGSLLEQVVPGSEDLRLVPDTEFKRLKATVDMKQAVRMFNMNQ